MCIKGYDQNICSSLACHMYSRTLLSGSPDLPLDSNNEIFLAYNIMLNFMGETFSLHDIHVPLASPKVVDRYLMIQMLLIYSFLTDSSPKAAVLYCQLQLFQIQNWLTGLLMFPVRSKPWLLNHTLQYYLYTHRIILVIWRFMLIVWFISPDTRFHTSL